MGNPKLRAVRERYAIGDDVLVHPRNQGGAGVELAQPKRARIVDVMGTAAAVMFDDAHREIVIFKRLQKLMDGELVCTTDAPAVVSVVTIPMLQSVASNSGQQDDVATWLEMGRSLATQMRSNAAAKRDEANELRAEAQALIELAKCREAEADTIAKQLAGIERIAEMLPTT